MHKVLIVEDDAVSAELARSVLEKNGYKVSVTATAEDALKRVSSSPPDVVILDLQLPGMSGMRFCKIVKEDAKTASLPIIMLTTQNRESQKVEGLDTGADDYITKPYSPKELIARVAALLRRVERQGAPRSVLQAGKLELDLEAHKVTLNGKPLTLRPKEYDLLALFLKSKGRLLLYNFIAEAVWGDDRIATRQDIKFWISQLRDKLGPMGTRIETVINQGYRFSED